MHPTERLMGLSCLMNQIINAFPSPTRLTGLMHPTERLMGLSCLMNQIINVFGFCNKINRFDAPYRKINGFELFDESNN